MKTNKDVIGLPLMGIQDGVECGVISDLIFSVEQKNIQYIILDSGRGLFGLKTLPFSKIIAIGKDLITTQSGAEAKSIWEDKDAIALGFTTQNLINARVISNDGNIAGYVREFCLDEKSGAVEHLLLDSGAAIPGDDILTLSAGSVFITESAVPPSRPEPPKPRKNEPFEPIREAPSSSPNSVDAPPFDATNPIIDLAEEQTDDDQAGDNTSDNDHTHDHINDTTNDQKNDHSFPRNYPVPIALNPASKKNKNAPGDPSLSGLFAQRQLEYLVGRAVTKDIKAKGGKLLAKSGELVTEDLVRKIKDEGRLPELTLNVR